MAIPELLIASVLQSPGNGVQVANLVGGTIINQIGATLTSTSFDPNSNVRKNVANFAVEYRGEIHCHFLTNNVPGVWSLNKWNGTAWNNFDNYELTGQFPGGSGTYTECLGSWVVNTGSLQRIFTLAFNSSSGSLRMLYSDDGSSFTFSPDLGPFSTFLANGKHILFNNKLYIVAANGSAMQCFEIDPIAITATEITTGLPIGGAPSTTHAAFAVYSDSLFLCTENYATGTSFNLYEFTGGGWTFNTTIKSSMNFATGNPERGACAMFTDPATGDLIVFFNGTDGSFARGSFCTRLTPNGSTFTPTEITSTVVPSGLRPGVRGSVASAIEDRWFVFASTDNVGATEIYLFVAAGPAPGAGYTVYQWQGVGAEASLIGAGPSTIYAIPETAVGGGDRIYATAAAGKPTYESKEEIPNGVRIYYRVYGGTATAPVFGTIKLYYNQEQEDPNVQATLFGTPAGGILNGDQVDNVEADDGGTLYSLDWNSIADGVPSGDAVNILLDFE